MSIILLKTYKKCVYFKIRKSVNVI